MHRRLTGSIFVLLGWLAICAGSTSFGQPARGRPLSVRPIAPGVMITVPPASEAGDTFTGPENLLRGLTLPVLNPIDPVTRKPTTYIPPSDTLSERMKQVIFRREIWHLEFSFKPLRMLEVDVPDPRGVMQRKVIWYMIYRVRNIGGVLSPAAKADEFGHETFTTKVVNAANNQNVRLPADDQGVTFNPHFVLEGLVHKPNLERDAEGRLKDPPDGSLDEYKRKVYLDRILPSVKAQILAKEVIPPSKPMLLNNEGKPVLGKDGFPEILLNTVQMSKVKIPLSNEDNDNSVWGIATWEDIDPTINYISVYVKGLTNAFHMEFLPDGKSRYVAKTLQINHWRPGDAQREDDDTIYYGTRLVSRDRPHKQYEQIKLFDKYEIPGPELGLYLRLATTEDGDRFDKDVNLLNVAVPVVSPKLEMPIMEALNKDANVPLPQPLLDAIAKKGVTIPPGTRAKRTITGKLWDFEATIDGVKRRLQLRYEPKYWEVDPFGMRVRKPLDHFWIYR